MGSYPDDEASMLCCVTFRWRSRAIPCRLAVGQGVPSPQTVGRHSQPGRGTTLEKNLSLGHQALDSRFEKEGDCDQSKSCLFSIGRCCSTHKQVCPTCADQVLGEEVIRRYICNVSDLVAAQGRVRSLAKTARCM